jgi:hypothetical protein
MKCSYCQEEILPGAQAEFFADQLEATFDRLNKL